MARRRGSAMLGVLEKEVIAVPAEMRVKHEHGAAGKGGEMYLSRRDLAGTMVAVLVVLAYAANVQDWWYLGSNRWAAVTMLAVGFAGCALGARIVGESTTSAPIVLLAALGIVTLVLAAAVIVTGAQWALLALALSVVALWAGATLRHAVTPPPRPAVQ